MNDDVIPSSFGYEEPAFRRMLFGNLADMRVLFAYAKPAAKSSPTSDYFRLAPPLISVDKGLFNDPLQFMYQLRDQIEFQAHGRGYLGPFAQEPATSWAAPHLAGIAARILSLKPDLKPFEIKTILYWMFCSSKEPRTQ